MKDQNENQTTSKDLPTLTVVWVQSQSSTGMKDRTHVLDFDKLSMYGQDDLLQSAFVVIHNIIICCAVITFNIFSLCLIQQLECPLHTLYVWINGCPSFWLTFPYCLNTERFDCRTEEIIIVPIATGRNIF